MYLGWDGFVLGKWSNDEVNVRDFIQRNYAPYEGDAEFLAPAVLDIAFAVSTGLLKDELILSTSLFPYK